MIARIWQTSIRTGRRDDYDAFARDRSLPMFRAQEGILGVLLLGDGTERRVLTLWRERASIAALEASDAYRATVAALVESGILVPDTQTTELHIVTSGWAAAP